MRTAWMAVIYVVALCAANYSASMFGAGITPVNAFILIGLDLVLRDKLHDAYGFLGACGIAMAASAISWATNPAAATIAMASAASFATASIADGSVYHWLRGESYMVRSNSSNAAGAIVDSVVFPTIAFGVLMPEIIAAQFLAKCTGGFLWSALLRKREAVA